MHTLIGKCIIITHTLIGRCIIMHTLTGTCNAAVALPRYGDMHFPQGINNSNSEYLEHQTHTGPKPLHIL